MVDQLTSFALKAYGGTVSKTSLIDALAERAMVFENAYCPNPLMRTITLWHDGWLLVMTKDLLCALTHDALAQSNDPYATRQPYWDMYYNDERHSVTDQQKAN